MGLDSVIDLYNQYVEKYQLNKKEEFGINRYVFAEIVDKTSDIKNEI